MLLIAHVLLIQVTMITEDKVRMALAVRHLHLNPEPRRPQHSLLLCICVIILALHREGRLYRSGLLDLSRLVAKLAHQEH